MGFNFKTIQNLPNDLNRLQSNISDAFNSVVGPFIGGNLITGVSLQANTPSNINHRLGRKPILWVLCDQLEDANVWRIDWNQNSITLEAGADCTISLWVN